MESLGCGGAFYGQVQDRLALGPRVLRRPLSYGLVLGRGQSKHASAI